MDVPTPQVKNNVCSNQDEGGVADPVGGGTVWDEEGNGWVGVGGRRDVDAWKGSSSVKGEYASDSSSALSLSSSSLLSSSKFRRWWVFGSTMVDWVVVVLWTKKWILGPLFVSLAVRGASGGGGDCLCISKGWASWANIQQALHCTTRPFPSVNADETWILTRGTKWQPRRRNRLTSQNAKIRFSRTTYDRFC